LAAVRRAPRREVDRGEGFSIGDFAGRHRYERTVTMLYTIAVVLLILWLLGLVTSYTLGGFIHILLVIALVVVLLGFIGGRRSL
jgi:hypothetical protein